MRVLKSLALFLGFALVVPSILGATPGSHLAYSLVVGTIALVALVRPLPRLGFGSRWVSCGVLVFAGLLGVLVSSAALHEQRELRWAALRETDPALYLSELKPVDRTRWLTELRRLDPEAYEDERQRRAAELEQEHLAAARVAEAERRQQCGQHNATQAYISAQLFVERELRSPTTAQFPSIHNDSVTSTVIDDCVFRIHSYVDAQNGFGAMIREPFTVDIRRLPSEDAWELVTLHIGG